MDIYGNGTHLYIDCGKCLFDVTWMNMDYQIQKVRSYKGVLIIKKIVAYRQMLYGILDYLYEYSYPGGFKERRTTYSNRKTINNIIDGYRKYI